MVKRKQFGSILLFAAKFLVLVTVLGAAWWWLIPAYGWLLVQACGGILHFAMGVGVERGWVESRGFLNTESLLYFQIGERARAMPVALLVTNVAPYVALVLATGGLTLWRRIRILIYGTAILVAGHILYIVILLRYQEHLQQVSEIPVAVMQFFLTLPFLLWIMFAYWDRILQTAAEEEAEDEGGP